MANKYCNLDGSKKIKDEYKKINEGFDKVEDDLDNNLSIIYDDLSINTERIDGVNTRVDQIITTPIEGISTEEIVEARQGFISLGSNLTGIKDDIDKANIRIGERWVSVKSFGAKGDGVNDDTEVFKLSIEYCIENNCTMFIPGGTYKITDTLVINDPIKIIGASRVHTILNFSLGSKSAFSIAQSKSVSGLYMGHFTMNGNLNATGIEIGSYREKAGIVDSVMDHIKIFNFRLGLDHRYGWCNSFRSIRIQMSVKPLAMSSQSNSITFDTCSFVSYSEKIRFTNCEGILLNSCNIANMTNPDEPMIELYQSTVMLNNPYFENIGNHTAIVGGVNEVIKSSLVITGGIITGGVMLGGNDCTFILNGSRVRSDGNGTFQVRNSSQGVRFFTTNMLLNITDGNFREKSKLLLGYTGNKRPTFSNAYGGSVLSQELKRGFGLITQTVSGNGIRIFDDMEIGEQYTLAYAIRKGDDSPWVSIREDSRPSVDFPVQDAGEDFEIRYIPFVARGATLKVLLNGSIEVLMLRLYEGLINTDLELPNFTEYYSSTVPTSGSWRLGDRVNNTSPKTETLIDKWIRVTTGESNILGEDWVEK